MEQASIYSFQTKPIGRYLVSPRNCATLQITQASINRLPTKPVIGLFSVSLNEQAQTVGHGSLRKKLINAIHVKALKKRFPTIFEMHSTFTYKRGGVLCLLFKCGTKNLFNSMCKIPPTL